MHRPSSRDAKASPAGKQKRQKIMPNQNCLVDFPADNQPLPLTQPQIGSPFIYPPLNEEFAASSFLTPSPPSESAPVHTARFIVFHLRSPPSVSSLLFLYMSKCSWLSSLVILQAVCSACWQVAGANALQVAKAATGQIGGVFVYLQDPSWMSRRALDELVDGSSGDEDLADHGASPQPEGEAGDHGAVTRGDAAEAEADVDVDGGRSGEVECQVCHKRFKNDKSMFGHLRSHPNRGYKGATPPLKMSSTPSSSSPVIPAGDTPLLSSSLRPIGNSNSSMSTPGISLTTYEKLAACVMLTLTRRYDRDQRQLQAPPPSSASCSNKRKHESVERAATGAGELATNIMEGAKGSSHTVHRDEHEARRKKGKRKLKEPTEAERTVKKDGPSRKKKRHPYMCKHCNEEFSTHQALGGHMAGHHKEKRILLKEKQLERSLVLEEEPERSHHLMEKHPARGLILEKKQLERSSIVLKEKQPEMRSIVFKEKQRERSLILKEEQPELGGGSNTAPIAQEDSRAPFGFDLNVEAPEQE